MEETPDQIQRNNMHTGRHRRYTSTELLSINTKSVPGRDCIWPLRVPVPVRASKNLRFAKSGIRRTYQECTYVPYRNVGPRAPSDCHSRSKCSPPRSVIRKKFSWKRLPPAPMPRLRVLKNGAMLCGVRGERLTKFSILRSP